MLSVEDMLSYEEFLNLPEDQQKETLIMYRNLFTNREIIKGFSITSATLYKLINKLQLPKAERGRRLPKVAKKEDRHKQTKVDAYIVDGEAAVQPYKAPEEVEGVAIGIKGTYTADKLINRLERTMLMLLDEEAEFEIDLKIKEKA